MGSSQERIHFIAFRCWICWPFWRFVTKLPFNYTNDSIDVSYSWTQYLLKHWYCVLVLRFILAISTHLLSKSISSRKITEYRKKLAKEELYSMQSKIEKPTLQKNKKKRIWTKGVRKTNNNTQICLLTRSGFLVSMHVGFGAKARASECVAGVVENWWTNICIYLLLSLSSFVSISISLNYSIMPSCTTNSKQFLFHVFRFHLF